MHGGTHSHILTHTNDLGPRTRPSMSALSLRSGIQVSSVYPTYTHIKGQCVCVCVFVNACICVCMHACVCVCSQASRSRATLSCDSSYCICENNDADQLRGNREADQRLCFRYTDSTIPLLSKSEIFSF